MGANNINTLTLLDQPMLYHNNVKTFSPGLTIQHDGIWNLRKSRASENSRVKEARNSYGPARAISFRVYMSFSASRGFEMPEMTRVSKFV